MERTGKASNGHQHRFCRCRNLMVASVVDERRMCAARAPCPVSRVRQHTKCRRFCERFVHRQDVRCRLRLGSLCHTPLAVVPSGLWVVCRRTVGSFAALSHPRLNAGRPVGAGSDCLSFKVAGGVASGNPEQHLQETGSDHFSFKVAGGCERQSRTAPPRNWQRPSLIQSGEGAIRDFLKAS
jgi:hypothetical protein